MNLDQEIGAELAALAAASRLRTVTSLTGLDRIHVSTDDGRDLLAFCSNDYLGLSAHEAVKEKAIAATRNFGTGAGASRLVTGQAPPHRELEQGLARFLSAPDVLLFPTGYQANLGVLAALAGPNDLIVSDAANHASIIDGCRLSRARISIYPHCDVAAAERLLATTGPFRRRLLVTESVFSMDGDRAPLPQLANAAERHGAVLMVDEAHALGVVGPRGKGLAADSGVAPQVLVGTLGKALGAHGGFVAGSVALRACLINRARQFIYTTAGPPSAAAAASTALHIISSAEGDELRQRAASLAAHARLGLRALGIEVPGQDLILPLVLGEDSRAVAISAALLAQGILVPAIRPPTVPPGTARLRITISAAHSLADVDRLLQALIAARAGLRSGPSHVPSP